MNLCLLRESMDDITVLSGWLGMGRLRLVVWCAADAGSRSFLVQSGISDMTITIAARGLGRSIGGVTGLRLAGSRRG